MSRQEKINEAKIAEARKLFDGNPYLGWQVIGEATGINPSTLRHIFRRRWGLTARNRIQASPALDVKPINYKEAYSIESVASVIAGLSDLVKKLRTERDVLELQVKDLSSRGNSLASNLIEAQRLLAQENRR